jgi:hypothetical protein
MIKKRTLSILILIQLLLSCTKESTELRMSDFNIPIITGYYLRNIYGEIMGKVGSPNVKSGDKSNYGNSEYFLVFYPNPCDEHIGVHIKSPVNSSTKKLWITPAIFDERTTNSSIYLNSANIVVGGYPVYQTELDNNNIFLNLENIENGYYRLYLKIDDILLYDNLVIAKTN